MWISVFCLMDGSGKRECNSATKTKLKAQRLRSRGLVCYLNVKWSLVHQYYIESFTDKVVFFDSFVLELTKERNEGVCIEWLNLATFFVAYSQCLNLQLHQPSVFQTLCDDVSFLLEIIKHTITSIYGHFAVLAIAFYYNCLKNWIAEPSLWSCCVYFPKILLGKQERKSYFSSSV